MSIKKAVELIDLGLSIKTTAKLFGIPKETMQYYMANRQEFAPEQATMFTNEDEMELVEWIVNCSRKGLQILFNKLEEMK